MKKVLSLTLMAFALVAFVSSASYACGEKSTDAKKASAETKSCSATKTNAIKASADSKSCSATATKTADKAACAATCNTASKTNATMTAANGACTKDDIAKCAEKMGISVEECAKMCGENGTMTMHKIAIEGMTCGGCEASLTKAIEAVPGVQKVVSISYKEKNAVVCVDKNNSCTETLTKAITDKGYTAQIIPAVAKTNDASAKASCSKTCTAAEKAACASKEKDSSKKPEDTK